MCKGGGVSKWSQYFYTRSKVGIHQMITVLVLRNTWGWSPANDFYDQGRGGGGWVWGKNQDRKPCNCPDLVLLSWKLPGSSEGSNKDFPPLLFLIFHQGRSGTEFRRVCRSKLSADEKDGEEKGETTRLCVWLWQFCNNKAYLTLEEGWGSK